jgi:hypothetical protein
MEPAWMLRLKATVAEQLEKPDKKCSVMFLFRSEVHMEGLGFEVEAANDGVVLQVGACFLGSKKHPAEFLGRFWVEPDGWKGDSQVRTVQQNCSALSDFAYETDYGCVWSLLPSRTAKALS